MIYSLGYEKLVISSPLQALISIKRKLGFNGVIDHKRFSFILPSPSLPLFPFLLNCFINNGDSKMCPRYQWLHHYYYYSNN